MRAIKARTYIDKGDVVLDVGCYTGEFLKKITGTISKGYGIDCLTENKTEDNLIFKKIGFKKRLPFKSRYFDKVVILAVLEHIKNKKDLAKEIYRVLKKEGKVIITVPSPKADKLLEILVKLKIIDEIDFIKQHTTPAHSDVLTMFNNCEFKLLMHKKFQFGYNNIYIFMK